MRFFRLNINNKGVITGYSVIDGYIDVWSKKMVLYPYSEREYRNISCLQKDMIYASITNHIALGYFSWKNYQAFTNITKINLNNIKVIISKELEELLNVDPETFKSEISQFAKNAYLEISVKEAKKEIKYWKEEIKRRIKEIREDILFLKKVFPYELKKLIETAWSYAKKEKDVVFKHPYLESFGRYVEFLTKTKKLDLCNLKNDELDKLLVRYEDLKNKSTKRGYVIPQLAALRFKQVLTDMFLSVPTYNPQDCVSNLKMLEKFHNIGENTSAIKGHREHIKEKEKELGEYQESNNDS